MSNELLSQFQAALGDQSEKIQGMIAKANAESEERQSSKFMAELKSHTDEFKALQDEVTKLAQDSFKPSAAQKEQSIGQALVGSDAYKKFTSGQASKASFEFQANTISGETAGTPNDILAPFDRMAGIVGGPTRELSILDFVPAGTTTSNSIEYTREASFTNNAAETAEGGAKPESDLGFELITAPVRTIPHWLKVTRQVMDDAPALRSYIDNRLRYGCRLRLEQQIVNGNGTGQNLSGVATDGTAVNFTGVTAIENYFDAARRLKTNVMTADYMPDFFWINPQDKEALDLIKRGTADAAYVGSNTADGSPARLWGLPVIESNSVPVGTMICGSRDAMMLWMRQGVEVAMSESDGSNFTTNLITIRAEMRAAFSTFRADALQVGDLTTVGES